MPRHNDHPRGRHTFQTAQTDRRLTDAVRPYRNSSHQQYSAPRGAKRGRKQHGNSSIAAEPPSESRYLERAGVPQVRNRFAPTSRRFSGESDHETQISIPPAGRIIPHAQATIGPPQSRRPPGDAAEAISPPLIAWPTVQTRLTPSCVHDIHGQPKRATSARYDHGGAGSVNAVRLRSTSHQKADLTWALPSAGVITLERLPATKVSWPAFRPVRSPRPCPYAWKRDSRPGHEASPSDTVQNAAPPQADSRRMDVPELPNRSAPGPASAMQATPWMASPWCGPSIQHPFRETDCRGRASTLKKPRFVYVRQRPSMIDRWKCFPGTRILH